MTDSANESRAFQWPHHQFTNINRSGVPPGLVPGVPSGLGRMVVLVVVILLLLMSGDIEMNPGPLGEFL